MRSRDREQASQSRSRRKERHTSPSLPPTSGEEQLDHLILSILARTLAKFDSAPSPSQSQDQSQSRDEHDRGPVHAQSNELARLVLGQIAQFTIKRYLRSRKNKAASARAARAKTAAASAPSAPSAPMPFLFGSGGRPLGSGERERMQRRREAVRSGSYDGNQEVHLTDPLPPEPVPVVPPRDPAPEPKLRRRRRHPNLSGRDRDKDAADARPPLVIPPSPETPPPPPLPRSYTWDSTPSFPPGGTSIRYTSYDRPASRSPYSYHPNYPLHEPYSPESRRRRTSQAGPTGPADSLTPPLSPYRPPETPRELQRRRESERDIEREQRSRDREYDKERRQRKGEARPREAEKEREKEREREREKERTRSDRERERISLERSREAALALSIDDLLKQIRKTDDIVYRTLYRPLVDKYDEHGDRDRGRCSCRSIIMQSAGLQRSLARSRSAAHAVRDLLEVPLVEDRRRRRRSTVHFVSEQTM